ncbi:Arc family DNA-binding protein [Paracoccus rhizosphaerae]
MGGERFIVRMPSGWREAIKRQAVRNRRSMNQEILAALEGVVSEAARSPEDASNAA